MIEFPCPACSAALRVTEAKAGRLVRCPGCGGTARAPAAAPTIVEELPVVEDDEEEEAGPAEAVEEDARPRERRLRAPRPRRQDEGEREFVTRNRIMGAVGFLIGLGFVIGALAIAWAGAADLRNPLTTPYNCAGYSGLLFGVLLIVVGTVYAIRG